MAAGALPAPGTELGPCTGPVDGREPCGHDDCAETRWIAGSACPWCDKLIGYGRAFYRLPAPADEPDGEDSYAHATCHEKAVGW